MHPRPPSLEHVTRQQQRLALLRDTLATALQGRERATLEIGSGHGHYLTAYASAHPSHFCLGIDIMSDRLVRSERKRARARLTNLAFIHAAAEDVLLALPDNVLLDDILVLFPDPWPKRRHHKNRLIQPEFLRRLAEKSTREARLCFRTDFADYFAAAQSTIGEHDAWKIDLGAPWPFEMPTVFQSRAPTYQSLIAIRT